MHHLGVGEKDGSNGVQNRHGPPPQRRRPAGFGDTVDDAQAILLSDVYPTAWSGARLAEIADGDAVAIVGAGPIGQAAVACARLQGAGRIIVVDGVPDRLELARDQHAETVDFNADDPVEAVMELTGGNGADRVIDAVGVDAQRPSHGAGGRRAPDLGEQFDHERDEAAPGRTWVPGDAPSLAARWAVHMVAKAGTIGTVGVYPPQVGHYPFGEAFMKNLTLSNCDHRRHTGTGGNGPGERKQSAGQQVLSGLSCLAVPAQSKVRQARPPRPRRPGRG